MIDFLKHLFDTDGFMPRWKCGFWTDAHGWLYILASIGIWSAYLAIPIVLSYFIWRKKELPFRGVFVLFGGFILACGTTHLVDAMMFWWPAYRFSAFVLLATAIISWVTAIALIPIMSKVLTMRTPDELEREIIGHKKTTAELDEINQQLRAAERLKDEFVANVSHEIRTPMNGVIGMTELVLETQLTQEQREYLETIKFSAESLTIVINDILDFSKIQAGKLDLEAIEFQLRPAMSEFLKPLTARARAKGLQLSCEIDSRVPDAVIGDPHRLRQIIVNLVCNAIKFTEKGYVFVRVTTNPEEERTRTGTSRPTKLHFAVTDTGIGIPPERQHVIFDAFAQVDGATTRQFGGTGLGLAICKQLVELMGGTLNVDSMPGCGSTFYFSMMVAQPVTEERLMPASEKSENIEQTLKPDAPTTAAAPLRVLVAEDNPVNQRLVLRILEKRGHTVVIAGNGQEAINRLAGDDFDLVLMDIHMPVLDGMAATQAIREQELQTGKHVPIVALTASAMKGDRERFTAGGFDDYLSKPMNAGQLLDLMARIVPAREPALSS